MDLVATMLPLALVVGLSPLPIMPAVLLLMSARPVANGLGFLVGWLIALTSVLVLALLLGREADPGPPTDAGVAWVQVLTGAAFLIMALVKFWRRAAPGVEQKAPRWMATLDSYRPVQSGRLGSALAAGNPKNIVMVLAAAAEIAILQDGRGQVVAGAAMFICVGSTGVGTPIVARALLGDRVDPALTRARTWLDSNATALAVGVLVVLGSLILLKGLSGAS